MLCERGANGNFSGINAVRTLRENSVRTFEKRSGLFHHPVPAAFCHGVFKELLFYKEDVLKHVERNYHPGE